MPSANKNTPKHLIFQADSSDEQQQQQQSQVLSFEHLHKSQQNQDKKPRSKFSGKDKFAIHQVKKGLFIYDQEEEYHIQSKAQDSLGSTVLEQQMRLKSQKTGKQNLNDQKGKHTKFNENTGIGESKETEIQEHERQNTNQKTDKHHSNRHKGPNIQFKSQKVLNNYFSSDEEDDQKDENGESGSNNNTGVSRTRNPNFRDYETPRWTEQQYSLKPRTQIQQSKEQQSTKHQGQFKSGNKLLQIDFSSSQQGSNQQSSQNISQSRQNSQTKIDTKQTVEYQPLSSIKLEDFFFTYNQKNTRINTLLKRDRTGLSALWPEYSLHFGSIPRKQLMFSKKLKMSASAQYDIFAPQNSSLFFKQQRIGKMDSNYAGTVYNIYVEKVTNELELRATVFYPKDVAPRGPREFKVFLLNKQYNYRELYFGNGLKSQNLQNLYQKIENQSKITVLENRKPVFSEIFKGFVLNFDGRVKQASIKNFILEDAKTKQEALMFGKQGENTFALEISHPLNGIIALGICLTQFESRSIE